MRKLVIALLALGILALPAHAQRRGRGPTPEEMEKKREAAEIDAKYKAALQRTGTESTAATRKDPWANMRGSADGKQ